MTDILSESWKAARQNQLSELEKYVPSRIPADSKIYDEKNHCHSLLMAAAAHGATDCAKYLLENGANPNLKNFNGFTALHWAAFTGRTEVVPLLLDYGADIEARIADGKTAVHIASFRGQRGFLDYILKRNADINAVDSDGNNALCFAALANQQATVEFLLRKGIETDQLNCEKKSLKDLVKEKCITWLTEMLDKK